MAWGEGDEERNLQRDLDKLNRTAENIQYTQMINSMSQHNRSGSGNTVEPGAGAGALLFLLFLMVFPLVIVLHLLGVDNGSGFVSGLVSFCWNIYKLIWGIFLWSLNNPITIVLISIPLIGFAICILIIYWAKLSDLIEDIGWRIKRPKKRRN
jgi:hypothetical protein